MWDSWCYDPIRTVLVLNDAFQGLVIVVDLHYKPQTSFSLNSLCDFAVDVSGFVKEGKKSCGSSSAGSVVASTVGQTNIRHLITQGTTALHKSMIWQTHLSTVVWMNYWAGRPLRLHCVVFLDTIFFSFWPSQGLTRSNRLHSLHWLSLLNSSRARTWTWCRCPARASEITTGLSTE